MVKQPQTSVKRGEVGVVVAWSGFMIAHTCGTIHAFVARAMSPATIAMSSHTVKTMIPQHVAIVVVRRSFSFSTCSCPESFNFFFLSPPRAPRFKEEKKSQNQIRPHHEWREYRSRVVPEILMRALHLFLIFPYRNIDRNEKKKPNPAHPVRSRAGDGWRWSRRGRPRPWCPGASQGPLTSSHYPSSRYHHASKPKSPLFKFASPSHLFDNFTK